LQVEFVAARIDDLLLQIRDALLHVGRDVLPRDARAVDGGEHGGQGLVFAGAGRGRVGRRLLLLRRARLSLCARRARRDEQRREQE
jgi:hypothetical protein